MITVGIDCGTQNTKAVVLKYGEIIGLERVLTGLDPEEAIEACLYDALQSAGASRGQVHGIGGTGAGKKRIHMADELVNDGEALALGALFFYPNVRTVMDVGAEEARAVRMDENAHVVDVVSNERCAAGTGIFVEIMAKILDIPLEEMGPVSLASDEIIPMNAQCAVFAEAEAIALIHAGTPKEDISRAIHEAMASRIVSLVRRVGINEEVVMMGGMARNPGLVAVIQRELGVDRIKIPEACEYGAAIGAARMAGKPA